MEGLMMMMLMTPGAQCEFPVVVRVLEIQRIYS